MHALADYAAEHGDRGLRALGGRREAQRWLEAQDAARRAAGSVPELAKLLGLRIPPPPPPRRPPARRPPLMAAGGGGPAASL